MRKIITLILTALMILPMFISCSGDTKTNAGTTVTAPAKDTTAGPVTEPVTTSADTEKPQTTSAETKATTTTSAVSPVTLNAAAFTLDEGYSVFLKATAADSVTFTSSESSVATVDSAGKVTAKSAGKAIITAKSAGGRTAACTVTVNKRIIAVTKVTLDRNTLALTAGQSYNYSPTVTPGNASDTRVALVSDNTAVAVVSGFRVTAIGAGSVTVTAKASDGNGASAVCTVTVTGTEAQTAKPEVMQPPAETKPPYDEDSDLSLPKTNKPVYAAQSIIRNGTVCVSGSCEEGSVVTVSGSTVKEFTVKPQEKRFFFTVSLKTDQSDTLIVTAKVNGKRTSDPTGIKVKYGKGNVDVVVGSLSQLHYPMTLNDYYGNNLFNDSQLEALSKLVDLRLAKVREKSGVDTKLIYLVAPNNLTIYPETARDEWKVKKKTTDSRLQQFIHMMNERNDPNTIAIDIVDFMIQNKDKGKLYYQTDTHWNTLGAYFGYYKLMKAIAVDFPAAAPYELDKFDVKAIKQEGGDLVRFLGITTSQGSETTYSCTLKGTSQATVVSEDGAIPSTAFVTSTVNNSKLPTAVVMRDSFGYSIQMFLYEHFGKLTYTTQSCGLDTVMTYVADAKPDYFIHILIERYIDQLLGG